MFKLPEIDELLVTKSEARDLEQKYVKYNSKNQPTSRVKKTYVEACEEKNISPKIETTITPNELDYETFLRANPNYKLLDGVLCEQSIHGEEKEEEHFEMPPVTSLFKDN